MEGGKRVNVAAWFRLEGGMARFALAPYDRRKALVIDPVLGFSATVTDRATTLTTDSNGNAYLVAGEYTGGDALYIKLDTQGKLVYKTYVGGFSVETPGPMAVDSNGNLFVSGSTLAPAAAIAQGPVHSRSNWTRTRPAQDDQRPFKLGTRQQLSRRVPWDA
jgi:hypothetical protein